MKGVFTVKDPTLEMYEEVLPHLKDFICMDFMVGLTDGDKFLGFWNRGKMTAPIKSGDILKSNDPMRETFRTGKIIDVILPEDIHGFPFRSITAPVKNHQGKIVGTIGFGLSLEMEHSVKKIQNDIMENITSSTDDLSNISEFVKQVSSETKTITDLLDNILKTTQQINSVTKDISDISSQTNVLAINASIEASHAGEFGKGFAIVAQQMRTLATTSKESSNKILDMLQHLSKGVNTVTVNLEELMNTIKNQQEFTSNVSKNIDNIKSLSKSIENIFKG